MEDTQKTAQKPLQEQEHEEAANPPEVSEVRIDIEKGTITLKLAEK
jgi:hypothetical protein